MSLKNKEKQTRLLTDNIVTETKRAFNLMLVVTFLLQFILPVMISVDASASNDAIEPKAVEVQAQEEDSNSDSKSTKTLSVAEEPAEEVEEVEEPETPPAPAPEVKEEPGDNVVDEPVNKPEENTKEEPNAPPASETPQEEEAEEVVEPELSTSEDAGIMQSTNLVYHPDNDFEVIDLSGAVSQNNHTQAKWIWVQDGYLYMAVASTHGIQTLTVNGVSAQASASGEFIDGAHSVVVHNVHDKIMIEGFGGPYSPVDYISGNTKDARWSIVRFYNPYELLNLQATGNTIGSTSIAGGGHNIGGNTKFSVIISTKSATLNKTWHLGPGGPVEVNLFTSNDGGITWGAEPYATVNLDPVDQGDGTFTATYNWSKLPYTDFLGRRLVYKAEEANPGENYDPKMTTHYNPNTNHYTFTLINTYQVPEQNLTVTKNWMGGPEKDHLPVDIRLWRTTDGITIDEVIGVDPVITPEPTEYSMSSSFTYTWEKLPQETDTGVSYTYYFTEEGGDSVRYERVYSQSVTIEHVLYGAFLEHEGTVTNNYLIPKRNVVATKNWVNGENVRPELWYQLRRTSTVNGEQVDEAVTVMELPDTGNTVEVTFTDIHSTDFKGNVYTFYVVEGTYNQTTKEFIPGVPENFNKTGSGLELTNTYVIPKNGSATATKIWQGTEPEDIFEVVLTLWRTTNAIDFEEVSVDPIVTPSGNELIYSYEWVELEETDIYGNDYTYYFTEEEVPEGYERIYSSAIKVGDKEYGKTKSKVTNRKMIIDFSFTKVDEMGNPLTGATFRLEKMIEGSSNVKVLNTGTDPVFLYEDLTVGTYTLTETSAPDGYYLPTNASWTFDVVWNEEMNQLEIVFNPGEEIDVDDELGYVIANYPKGMLPETGGPGNSLSILVGLLSLMSLGTIYVWRKKRDEVNQND